MEKKLFRSLFSFIALSLIIPALFLAGCTQDHFKIDSSVADPHGTVTGKVIAGTTRAGIANATVTLFVNGQPMRTTTQPDPFPTDSIDDAGYFQIAGVPTGTHTLRIEATGFATMETNVAVPATNEVDSAITVNVGTVAMAETFELIVDTTDAKTGAAVTGVTVFAEPTGLITNECQKAGGTISIFNGSSDVFEITAVSALEPNTTGTAKAHLKGLNSCEEYFIVAPAQKVGSKTFITASVTFNGAKHQGDEITLALSTEVNTDIVSIVATNLDIADHQGKPTGSVTLSFSSANLGVVDEGRTTGTLGTASPAQIGFTIPLSSHSTSNSVGSTGSIVLIFSRPVTVDDGTEITLVNDLIDADTADAPNVVDFPDDGFPAQKTVTVTTTLSANSTVLTIKPSTVLPPNESFKIHGVVRAADSPAILSLDSAAAGLGTTDVNGIYVSDDTTTSGLTAISQVTADNYNGATANSNVAPTDVSLNFPEAVTGTFRIVCIADGTTTCNDTGSNAVAIGAGNSSVVFNDGRLDGRGAIPASTCLLGGTCVTGKTAGVFFRVSLGTSLRDNVTGRNSQVKVFLDVTTADGTRLQGETAVLNVQ